MGRPRKHDTDLPEGIRRGKTPGTYEIRVPLPPTIGPDGRKRYHQQSRTVHGGIRAARQAHAEMVTTREQRGGSRDTVASHLATWLDRIQPDRSPTTMRNYRAFSRRYILPALGTRRLSKVTTRDLDELYSRMRTRGLAPGTIRQTHAILSGMFKDAVRQRELPVNPATQAARPPVRRRELPPPDVNAYHAIYERAARRPDKSLATFIRMAAGTGARRSELCRLQWQHFDWDGRSLLILKTKTGLPRRIALDPIVLEQMSAHLRAMDARAIEHGTWLRTTSFVFSDSVDGEKPWNPDRISTAFYRIRRELGFTIRLHDLRHLHATELLIRGVDVRTVAGRLGHADPHMTLGVYGHFVPAADQRAADLIGAIHHPLSLPESEGDGPSLGRHL
jgi:integrase